MADLPITSDEGATPIVINDPTTTANVANVTAGGALKVDASATTQPVSGTITANAGSGTFSVSGTVTANQGGAPWSTTLSAATSGGWSPSLQNGLSTTVATVKSSAGQLGGYYCYNPNSKAAYVQIFDASSVTLGTTVPKLSLGIPGGSAANLEFTLGVVFATAIKVAATTTATGAVAPTTALDCNFWFK